MSRLGFILLRSLLLELLLLLDGSLLTEIPSSRLSNGLYLDSRAQSVYHDDLDRIPFFKIYLLVSLSFKNSIETLSALLELSLLLLHQVHEIVLILRASIRIYIHAHTSSSPRGTDSPPCAKKFFHGDRYGSSWRTEIGAVPVTPMDYKHFHRTIPRKSLDCPICF